MIKETSVITLLALLSGCANLTPREQHLAVVGAAIIVTGAIAASQIEHANRSPNLPTFCGPSGEACR